MKRKNLFMFLVILTVILVVTSCANYIDVATCLPDKIYGFWGGLWHGIISPIVFIGKVFGNDSVAIYAFNNNGNWYDFGFMLGIGGLGGTTTKVSSR